mmetsp:Transcript_36436/g.88221  ORF Transcript_36436/g.88221 Transcript_36436/m.88221 type:complete len:89 (-) Transcript_36436:83-349(-)
MHQKAPNSRRYIRELDDSDPIRSSDYTEVSNKGEKVARLIAVVLVSFLSQDDDEIKWFEFAFLGDWFILVGIIQVADIRGFTDYHRLV